MQIFGTHKLPEVQFFLKIVFSEIALQHRLLRSLKKWNWDELMSNALLMQMICQICYVELSWTHL